MFWPLYFLALLALTPEPPRLKLQKDQCLLLSYTIKIQKLAQAYETLYLVLLSYDVVLLLSNS